MADTDTGRNSHVILLSSFSPFSSLSDACVSSAGSLNSSSQQKILSEFFFCLLLSFSYLMEQKTTKYLAKCWHCILPCTPLFIPPWHTKAIQRPRVCCNSINQQSKKSKIIQIYLKATFKTLLGRGSTGKEENTWYTSVAAQVWQHTADLEYCV